MAGVLSPVYGLSLAGGTLTGSLKFTGITGTAAAISGAGSIGTAYVTTGPVDVQTAGQGLSISNAGAQQGTNCKIGTGSLSAGGGAGTVANTSVTANSYIFVTDTEAGGVTNLGALAVISQSAGTNFVVKSSSATDTSTFNYFIVEPG
jgi:hypothetical protein